MRDYFKKFSPDDFDRIYIKYFKELWDNNDVQLDPSGWLNTHSNAAKIGDFYNNFTSSEIVPYYSDYNEQLHKNKEKIFLLISKWDLYNYQLSEFTLCSSVTVSSMTILAALSKKGIKNIIFETPAYYASINQSKYLKLKTHLIPTYSNDNFKLKIEIEKITKIGPSIIWLTQPRMSLGTNQNYEDIIELYNSISEDSYIVVDEASEQLFPSFLHKITPDKYPRIIKMRNFYKGIGINGIRMSFIAHHSSLRTEIQRELENVQGALDYFSLNHISELSEDIPKFMSMLNVSNNQTSTLRNDLTKLFGSKRMKFSELTNGYIGCVEVDLSEFPLTHIKNRENLLKYCSKNKMPIILGSTMKFAIHNQKEFIRINYFKTPSELKSSISLLADYLE